MRISYLFVVIATLALSACADVRTVDTSMIEGKTIVLPNGSYALVQAEPSHATITPSNPCAAGFDDVMTHLENLMAQKAKADAAAAQQKSTL